MSASAFFAMSLLGTPSAKRISSISVDLPLPRPPRSTVTPGENETSRPFRKPPVTWTERMRSWGTEEEEGEDEEVGFMSSLSGRVFVGCEKSTGDDRNSNWRRPRPRALRSRPRMPRASRANG